MAQATPINPPTTEANRPRAGFMEIFSSWLRPPTQRVLYLMDDRMLADIGVAPGDVPSRPMRLEWDRPRA